MILLMLLNAVLLTIGYIFQQLPVVNHLPSVAGYDVDGALVLGMGYFRTFANTFWYLIIVFQGFLVLTAYYGIKMVARLFFGHRIQQ